MKLTEFNNDEFQRGRSGLVEACWRIAEGLFLNSWLPGSMWRASLLRLFGATVGKGVVVKPHVRVKFPWKLKIGDHSWIGESAWIDNLAQVTIGANCCLSQGVYLCTGSHSWSSETFDLIVRPITIEDKAWIAGLARVAPGVTVGEGAVLGFGSVAAMDLEAWKIYTGNPAVITKERVITK